MSVLDLYTTPSEPASFSGVSTFRKNHPNLSSSLIKKTIKKNDVYSLHKPVKRVFTRRKTIVSGIDAQWQCDLMDIKKYKTSNNNQSYLLTCIDVFRRYAWVVPLKNKEAVTCRDAFLKIFSTNKPPKYIYSDHGSEFKGVCKKLFKEHNVIQLETKSMFKAALAERFNRTLREKIFRLITWNKLNGVKPVTRFIDKLDDLVKSYNSTIHSSIGTSPDKVNEKNEDEIRNFQYGYDAYKDAKTKPITFNHKIGDYVRVVEDKKLFDKGSTVNWRKEIYLIYQINATRPPTYKVKDLNEKEYDWNYYTQELQKIDYSEFPYDTFKVLEEKDGQSKVIKLNSDNQEPVWVDSKILN